MATTTFQDYNQNTPIVSTWLNDVNGVAYTPAGTKNVALQIPLAWVRFTAATGVISQSQGIQSVVRASTGVYNVTYANVALNAKNCYSLEMDIPGFIFTNTGVESTGGVQVNAQNTLGTPTDPGEISLVIYGSR